METIRPSNLYRRERCPGSAKLEVGQPETGSLASNRGARLHNLIHCAILKPETLNEALIEASDAAEFVEMCVTEARQIWQNLPDYQKPQAAVLVEKPVNMECFGMESDHTPDFAVVVKPTQTDDGIVFVRDWKSGYSYVPAAKYNLQLGAYGAALAYIYGVRGPVNVGIVKENIEYVDHYTYTQTEVADFAAKVKRIRERAENPDAPINPGPWCQFCKAESTCAARLAVVAEIKAVANPLEMLLAVTGQARTEAYERIKKAAEILEEVKDKIKEGMQAGTLQIDGYELGVGRQMKRWGPANKIVISALEIAAANKGLTDDDVIEPITPAKAEKLLGKAALSGMVVVSTGEPTIKRVKS